MSETVQSMDGKGELQPLVEFVGGRMQIRGESRKEIEYHGLKVTEVLFPKLTVRDLGKTMTLLWCITPLEKSYIKIGDRDDILNPMFHINFEPEMESIEVARAKIEVAFKEHHKELIENVSRKRD